MIIRRSRSADCSLFDGLLGIVDAYPSCDVNGGCGGPGLACALQSACMAAVNERNVLLPWLPMFARFPSPRTTDENALQRVERLTCHHQADRSLGLHLFVWLLVQTLQHNTEFLVELLRLLQHGVVSDVCDGDHFEVGILFVRLRRGRHVELVST